MYHFAALFVSLNMQKMIIKTTAFTLLGILTVAVETYTYFDLMFSDLAENNSFEEARIPHYL